MAIYIIVMKDGAPVGLLIVKDPHIWPYEWVQINPLRRRLGVSDRT
jgi:hypothetical protein